MVWAMMGNSIVTDLGTFGCKNHNEHIYASD